MDFEPININSVLATLTLSLLAINHRISAEAVKFVSSANNRSFALLRKRGRSLVYSKKSNSPKIEPCGTPHLIRRSDENQFPI